MPRPLLFGSGPLLVACDHRHRIRELTFPWAGQDNHLNGRAIAWGVWVDGSMHWVDGPSWQISMRYEPGGATAVCVLRSEGLGLEIRTREGCPVRGRRAFLREGWIKNLREGKREVKVFWNHDFAVGETSVGNAAYFHPDLGGMIHHRAEAWIGVMARSGEGGPDQWSCGVRMNPGEGSWRQCDSGHLNFQSAEVGAVDSTMGLNLVLEGGEEKPLNFAIVAGGCEKEVLEEGAWIAAEGWSGLLQGRAEAAAEWQGAFEDAVATEDLPGAGRAASLAAQLISALTGHEGGIIAACDSDIMGPNTLNYCNVWPRDGSLVADALVDAWELVSGPTREALGELVEGWLGWCQRALPEPGLFLQKYWPSGDTGVSWHPVVRHGQRVLPIQLDESSLTLSLASRWLLLHPEGRTGSALAGWTERLAEAILTYRDEEGLPLPSWDLWEERRGISFFAVATTIKGLALAGEALGRADFKDAADRMREAALRRMVGQDGSFLRQISDEGIRDETGDSAMSAGLMQGAFPWELPVVKATLDKTRRLLLDQSPIGGCARYEGDYYHRQSDDYPGSPWIMSTLWLAQAELASGGRREEALRLTRWALDRAESTGVLSESVHPVTGAPLSVSPLTWSHAELLRTLCLLATSGRG